MASRCVCVHVNECHLFFYGMCCAVLSFLFFIGDTEQQQAASSCGSCDPGCYFSKQQLT